jgi:NAD(P)H-flavin reductase
MTQLTADPPTANPWVPHLATIHSIKKETPGVQTFELTFNDPAMGSNYRFLPGQFNMLYLPGIGEAAISVSSDPDRTGGLAHTVRAAGNVTSAMARRGPGDEVGLRGPFGAGWPMQLCRGQDIVIAAGGVGLAPLRPALCHILNHRADYGRVILLYGGRTSGDLLYAEEYEHWRSKDIEVEVTVDIGDNEWKGNIGVVPVLFYRLRLNAPRTRLLTCGPEVMIRFVIFEALARRVKAEDIFLSMERNMKCAVGLCGHCQLGPAFVCKEGPVFSYRRIEPYLHVEDF